MTTLSKLLASNHIANLHCKDFAHPFQPSCAHASLLALKITIENSLVIYGTVYSVGWKLVKVNLLNHLR